MHRHPTRPCRFLSRTRSLKAGALTLCLLSAAAFPARTCEPCDKILGFEETVREARLIILGKKVKEGPWSDPQGRGFPGGPDWNEVQVLEIFKGNLKEKRIKVNSWDGMCGYGIQAGSKPLVMFLGAAGRQDDGESVYNAVNWGCAVKDYPVRRGRVEKGGKSISLEAFKSELKGILLRKRKKGALTTR